MIMQSLRGRLVVTAFVFLLLFLGLTGYALDRAFSNSIENSLLERLKTHLYLLLAAAQDDGHKIVMPSVLQDPEFNRIGSGRYAVMTDLNGDEIWRSPSAVDFKWQPGQTVLPGQFQLSDVSTEDESLYLLSYGIIWEREDGSEQRYHFNVLQNKAPTLAEISGFRTTLWRWLGGIGLVLLVLQSSILRWGLSPLPRLAKDLRQIEEGQQDQLTGEYPTELKGVAANLNLLIANERRQRQRYRDTMADLAHSLKTPMAILRGITSEQVDQNTPPKEIQDTIDEQVGRMNQIVNYQLHRASSPEVSLAAKPVQLRSLVDKLMRTLHKAYADKPVTETIDIDEHCLFLGDERDLMEVLGNILDNAFKACRRHIAVGVRIENDENRPPLMISIDDDGDGIAHELRDSILKRGVRADTNHPGQGIGLAVALDIIKSYKGSLEIGDTTLGGARFTIRLPGSH